MQQLVPVCSRTAMSVICLGRNASRTTHSLIPSPEQLQQRPLPRSCLGVDLELPRVLQLLRGDPVAGLPLLIAVYLAPAQKSFDKVRLQDLDAELTWSCPVCSKSCGRIQRPGSSPACCFSCSGCCCVPCSLPPTNEDPFIYPA